MMKEEEPKGLKFTVRDGGAKPSEAVQPEATKSVELEETKEELDHAVTNTKSRSRRQG